MSSPTRKQLVEILRRPLEALPDPLELTPVGGPFDVTIRPPGSKSIMNRALAMAALSDEPCVIARPELESEDTQLMLRAITQLGMRVTELEGQEEPAIRLEGQLVGGGSLHLGNAGTAARFLTAVATKARGPTVLDGNERLRHRPMAELIGWLRSLGAKIECLGEPGCLPVRVEWSNLQGRQIDIPTTATSQFVSALLMISSHCSGEPFHLRFVGEITSAPYVQMTVELLERCWDYEFEGSLEDGYLEPRESLSRGFSVYVEVDASGSTYVLGASALCPAASVTVRGLGIRSLQGDTGFRDILGEMNALVEVRPSEVETVVYGAPEVLRAIDTDLSLMPDTAQTLAAVACFAEGTTTIRGLRTLRVKETDRISAIQNELAKIGVKVEQFQYENEHGTRDEGIRITPPKGGVDCSDDVPHVIFDTYDDHRMAMSLALIGLRRPNVAIRDPDCVRKTYPTFWRDWSLLYESALAGGEPRGPAID